MVNHQFKSSHSPSVKYVRKKKKTIYYHDIYDLYNNVLFIDK